MASRRQRVPESDGIGQLVERLDELCASLSSVSDQAAKKILARLAALTLKIERTRADLDPVKDPGAVFEPLDPKTMGRLVVLALLSQDRVPLARIGRSYGSGVYALYYTGDHPLYQRLSGTENPLYVGKADPAKYDAGSSREQGDRLYARLADHRRMIGQVGEYAKRNGLPPLNLRDFECRRLVCATNAQLVAEKHLINMFKPVWNSEMRLAYGISKHGDSAKTRKNKRSPWDALHPGRAWADATDENQVPVEKTLKLLDAHLASCRIYRSQEVVLELLELFRQVAPMISEEQAALDDKVAEAKLAVAASQTSSDATQEVFEVE